MWGSRWAYCPLGIRLELRAAIVSFMLTGGFFFLGQFYENEADTPRKFVIPKLTEAGCDNEPHRINEQMTFTGWPDRSGRQ